MTPAEIAAGLSNRSAHCCLCGARRKPTQIPVESFSNDSRVIQMDQFRPMQAGRWEQSPQMIVSVQLYRNGGTAPGQTHICDDCFVIGLKHAKAFVDSALDALAVDESAVRAILEKEAGDAG